MKGDDVSSRQAPDPAPTDGAVALGELSLAPGAKVLDVGTGKGQFAVFLAQRGFDVLTGEPSTDRSAYANQDWSARAEKLGVRDRIRFQHFDAGKMPFPAASFDAVFFFGVLHHIDEALRRDVLREALRVARPGDAVVFFEPRKILLERIWTTDPGHPLAADPSLYLPDRSVRHRRIEGTFMDIYLFNVGAKG